MLEHVCAFKVDIVNDHNRGLKISVFSELMFRYRVFVDKHATLSLYGVFIDF
jgi:hypothetical protein